MKRGDIMSLSEEFMIQKSMPLLSELRNSKLTILELKLIEVYLSKINSHRPDKRTVTFTKTELQELFGKTLDLKNLKKSLETVSKLQVSEILVNGTLNTERVINLFEMSDLSYNDSDIQEIKLTCSDAAMKYIFNIEELHYLRYKLRNVAYLTSKYSYQLFLYLLENKFKSTWTIPVMELISLFNAPYDDYTAFNKYILKPCCKEINKKTNLNFEYTNIRRGLDRATKDIVFNIVSWGDLPQVLLEQAQEQEESKQITTENPSMNTQQPVIDSDEPKEEEQEEIPEHIAFLCESVDNSFTTLQMKLILATISNMDIPPSQFGREIAQFDYLHKKYLQLQITEQQTTIKNRFSYFLKMIENDAETR